MTKQLERLNIKPEYSLVPIPKSGHRSINKIVRYQNKICYCVYLYQNIYKTRTFKKLTGALCCKFVRILKYLKNTKQIWMMYQNMSNFIYFNNITNI